MRLDVVGSLVVGHAPPERVSDRWRALLPRLLEHCQQLHFGLSSPLRPAICESVVGSDASLLDAIRNGCPKLVPLAKRDLRKSFQRARVKFLVAVELRPMCSPSGSNPVLVKRQAQSSYWFAEALTDPCGWDGFSAASEGKGV